MSMSVIADLSELQLSLLDLRGMAAQARGLEMGLLIACRHPEYAAWILSVIKGEHNPTTQREIQTWLHAVDEYIEQNPVMEKVT